MLGVLEYTARFGVDRRAVAPPAPSTSHLNPEDFYLGLLTPYDPDFARQMALADDVMRDDREVLQALAK